MCQSVRRSVRSTVGRFDSQLIASTHIVAAIDAPLGREAPAFQPDSVSCRNGCRLQYPVPRYWRVIHGSSAPQRAGCSHVSATKWKGIGSLGRNMRGQADSGWQPRRSTRGQAAD
jgi:hypothetical protein